MTGKIFFIVFIVALLTFLLGWFLHDIIRSSDQITETKHIDSSTNTIVNRDTTKMSNADKFSNAISGRFIMAKSNCAGFNFIDKNLVLWTNEIACNDPDTLKIRWLDSSTFLTRSTVRINESCPPRVDIYKVVYFDGRHLTLKSIWTGWNDSNDDNLEFNKQSN